mmetsp:Transcript_24403/g.76984  ORF Transcript_24403/g.76984 Transcript_24403/m.76984 type:complete len:706 (+) Transcript_24403:113-2230(+)
MVRVQVDIRQEKPEEFNNRAQKVIDILADTVVQTETVELWAETRARVIPAGGADRRREAVCLQSLLEVADRLRRLGWAVWDFRAQCRDRRITLECTVCSPDNIVFKEMRRHLDLRWPRISQDLDHGFPADPSGFEEPNDDLAQGIRVPGRLDVPGAEAAVNRAIDDAIRAEVWSVVMYASNNAALRRRRGIAASLLNALLAGFALCDDPADGRHDVGGVDGEDWARTMRLQPYLHNQHPSLAVYVWKDPHLADHGLPPDELLDQIGGDRDRMMRNWGLLRDRFFLVGLEPARLAIQYLMEEQGFNGLNMIGDGDILDRRQDIINAVEHHGDLNLAQELVQELNNLNDDAFILRVRLMMMMMQYQRPPPPAGIQGDEHRRNCLQALVDRLRQAQKLIALFECPWDVRYNEPQRWTQIDILNDIDLREAIARCCMSPPGGRSRLFIQTWTVDNAEQRLVYLCASAACEGRGALRIFQNPVAEDLTVFQWLSAFMHELPRGVLDNNFTFSDIDGRIAPGSIMRRDFRRGIVNAASVGNPDILNNAPERETFINDGQGAVIPQFWNEPIRDFLGFKARFNHDGHPDVFADRVENAIESQDALDVISQQQMDGRINSRVAYVGRKFHYLLRERIPIDNIPIAVYTVSSTGSKIHFLNTGDRRCTPRNGNVWRILQKNTFDWQDLGTGQFLTPVELLALSTCKVCFPVPGP